MTRKSDKLKDKLNALKPSIPTNTRGEGPREEQMPAGPARAGRRAAPAAPKKPAAPPEIKIKVPEEKPGAPAIRIKVQEGKTEAPAARPAEKAPEKAPEKISAGGPGKQEKFFALESAFIFSDLVLENLASLNRMRDVMIVEANNINSMCVKGCWKSVAACYDAALNACGLFAPCSFGKWPFKFQAMKK